MNSLPRRGHQVVASCTTGRVSVVALAKPPSSSASRRRSSLAAPAIFQHDFPSSPGAVGGGGAAAGGRFGPKGSNGVLCLDPVPPPPPSPLPLPPRLPPLLPETEDTSRDGWHHDGSYRLAMMPRPHEIDEFGVVNNTRFNQFTYAARYALAVALGAPLNSWQSEGINGVTSKVCTSFRAPLRLGERFYATSGLRSVSRARVVLVEQVWKCGGGGGGKGVGGSDADTLVATSEVTCAFVDDDFRPVRMPEELRVLLERGAARYKAAGGAAESQ